MLNMFVRYTKFVGIVTATATNPRAVFWIIFTVPFSAIAQSNSPIAVVPFVNISQEPADDWIGSGIAETVANDLQELGMSVIGQDLSGESPTSGTDSPLDAGILGLARTSGARWIVTGSYQRVGEQLRITVRLVDVETGTVQQRGRVDGMWADLFQMQDQIVETLGGEIIPTPRTNLDLAVPGTPRDAGPEGTDFERDNQNLPGASGGFSLSQTRYGPTAVIRRTTNPPRIDGRLDDTVWQTATYITEFVQIAPVEGAPGTEETEVWMAYDDENLYFAFYAHYSDTGIMRINWGDRDETRGDDQMAVLFDPFLDQQRAYQFEVNGYGVQSDSLVTADATASTSSRMESSMSSSRSSGSRRTSSGTSLSSSGAFGIRGDDSWNALFDTGGRIVDDGWTAEMAIPFKSLRYPARAPGETHRWGFQVTRRIRGRSEAQSWSPVSRGIAGQLAQFGTIEGLEGLSESRNLEILPEVTGISSGSLDRTTGGYNQRDPNGDIGVGLKYGITPNLTADLAYNPDFSQIEADQPQIETNQRFALFYPEQRPFFLEGQEIFQMSTPLNLLNTRTIVDPRLGGKLTGKVGDTTLGVLVADDEAAGYLEDRTDPRFGTTAQTVVGRARYDFYSESYLGAIITAREFAEDHNLVGGIDGRFRLGPTHRLSFIAAGSSTRNMVDGSLGGPAVEVDLTRQGRNLGYSMSYGSIDPGFRTETGFLPRVDLRQALGTLSYRWWPESTIMTWGPTFTYFRLYDHAGVLQDEQIQAQTNFQFRNNIAITSTFSRDLERFQEIDFRKTGYGIYGVVSGRTLSVFGGFNVGDGILFSDSPFLGRTTIGTLNFSVRPSARMRIRLTSVFSRFLNSVGDVEVFNVKIYRARTTFQFTDRFLVRHIMEHNTQTLTLGNNLLLTYRLNAGTVVFLGYDDRYQSGTLIDDTLFPTTALQRTNHAVFGKVAYLFRY